MQANTFLFSYNISQCIMYHVISSHTMQVSTLLIRLSTSHITRVSTLLIRLTPFTEVPAGSPHGGDVMTYVWHKPTKLAHSFLFCSWFCFRLSGSFNCIWFHKFSQQLCFLTLFFRSYFCLIGPFNYISLFMKVSLSPDIILCGWPGLKRQLTN